MPRRVPRPLPSHDPPDPIVSRRPCPACGMPDAEVLFQLARCHNAECAYHDPDLLMSDDEVDRRRRIRWGQ